MDSSASSSHIILLPAAFEDSSKTPPPAYTAAKPLPLTLFMTPLKVPSPALLAGRPSPRTPATGDLLSDTLASSSLHSNDLAPNTPKDDAMRTPPMTASSPSGVFSFRTGMAPPPPSPLVTGSSLLSPRLPRSLVEVDQRYLFETLCIRLQQHGLPKEA